MLPFLNQPKKADAIVLSSQAHPAAEAKWDTLLAKVLDAGGTLATDAHYNGQQLFLLATAHSRNVTLEWR